MGNLFVEDHRQYILREMERRTHRRPQYSLRAMARDLQLAPSTLTDFLKDRIALSSGRIKQVSKLLGLNQEQSQHWEDLVQFRFSKKLDIKKTSEIRIRSRLEAEKNSISVEQFKAISEWQHLAILELIDMNSELYSDITKVAKALGITLTEAKTYFQRLESLKLIEKKEKVWAVASSTTVGGQTPSEAIRRFHRDILSKALTAIDTQPVDKRFFTSAIVGLTADQVQRIKDGFEYLPTKIFDPYLAEKSVTPRDQLYCFSLQFFSMLSEKEKSV